MEAQRREAIPIHLMPDSERLLRTHNSWVASWDGSNEEEEAPDIEALVREAFELYASGLLPIQVKWVMAANHSGIKASFLGRVLRRAEKALQAAEQAPPELRRALVAVTRQKAIQGALAAGEWGAALKGLERAGEIAGELRESAGLSEEDLVLTVSVESDPAPGLPMGESQPVSGETMGQSQAETEEE